MILLLIIVTIVLPGSEARLAVVQSSGCGH